MAAHDAFRKFGEWVHQSVYLRLFLLPCTSCGVEPAMGVDHLIPRSRGGRNILENLRPFCIDCNKRKEATEDNARSSDGRFRSLGWTP